MASNTEVKLGRALRRATSKSTDNPIQSRLTEVNTMLSSEAIGSLLDNGDLTPRAVVDSIKVLVSMASDGTTSASAAVTNRSLSRAAVSSQSNNVPTTRHFSPFGPQQVAEASRYVRVISDRVEALENRYADLRQSARELVDTSQLTVTRLVDSLEQGNIPQ